MPRAEITPTRRFVLDSAAGEAAQVYGTPSSVLDSEVGATGAAVIAAANPAAAQAAIGITPGDMPSRGTLDFITS